MKHVPYLIGLTGNIATGKSVVAGMLAGLGAQIIDADRVAHDLMEPGGPAHAGVVTAFGRDVLNAEGEIDRGKLGAVVFRDPEALRRLEAIVHPVVRSEVHRQIRQATSSVIVVEAIKLIEAGMNRRYNTLWVVTAPRATQIARLMAARGLSAEEAALRVDAQPPQAEKAALADVVFVNDGDLADLRRHVMEAWAQIGAT